MFDRYELIRGQDAPPEVVEGVVALDKISLDAFYHVSAQADRDLFLANRESGFILRERASGLVVGYSMLLPVAAETYGMIREGRFVDTDLRPEMVVRCDGPGVYDLYFASVVTHPQCRGLGLVMRLMDAMVEDFIALAERGVYMRRMLADVVSREGEKFCRFFGLREVCATDHGSKIYEVSGLPPTMRVTTGATKRLFDLYGARFAAGGL